MGLLVDTLRSVEFLSELEHDAFERFLVLGRCADFRKGHVFWRAGAEPQALVVPITGEAKLSTTDPDGHEYVDAFCGSGEAFGLAATLDGLPHASDATVTRDGEFYVLLPARFREFAKRNTGVSAGAVRLLGRRLRRSLAEREDMALRSVAERLARYFLEHSCVRQGDGAKVLRGATQAELAARIGTAREVIARTLGQFSRRGLVERTPGGLFISNWDGLRLVAGLPPEDGSSEHFSPPVHVRTARFFLPLVESHRPLRGDRDPEGCRDHLGDLGACRDAGCPGALGLSDT